MASAGTDVQAQRMVLNKMIDEHFKGKKYNDTVVDFKKLIKAHPHIISFYLFMAEFYRILNQDKHVIIYPYIESMLKYFFRQIWS